MSIISVQKKSAAHSAIPYTKDNISLFHLFALEILMIYSGIFNYTMCSITYKEMYYYPRRFFLLLFNSA